MELQTSFLLQYLPLSSLLRANYIVEEGVLNRFLLLSVCCFIGFGCGEDGGNSSNETDMGASNNTDTSTMMPENDNGVTGGDMTVNVDANPADAASHQLCRGRHDQEFDCWWQ